MTYQRQLSLRGRANTLLLEGHWLKGKSHWEPEPQTAPHVLVCTMHGSHHHQCIYKMLYIAFDKRIC